MSVQGDQTDLYNKLKQSGARLLEPRNGNGRRQTDLSARMQRALDNEKTTDKPDIRWINLMTRWVPEVRRLEEATRQVSLRTFNWGVAGGCLIVFILWMLMEISK